jgi:hypothetical protein
MRYDPAPLRLCGVLAVLSLFLSQAALPAQAPREGPWILNDLAAARDEARRTGKPIFAVFRCER